MKKQFIIRATCATLAFAHTGAATAAEDFQIRYNIAGSIGGEMFAPIDQIGWVGGIARTRVDIKKISGGDGNPLTTVAPGGAVQLPAPIASSLYPSYGPNTLQVDSTITVDQWNLGLAYITAGQYGGGRLIFGINVPYATKKQTVYVHGASPALNWNSAVPSAARVLVGAQFDADYQAALRQKSAAASGDITGLGDAEATGAWLYANKQVRVLAGATLVVPSGKYDASPGPDIGFGNFYTFRPAIQATYLLTPDFAVTSKFTAGINTRNKDNRLRSGNWVGVEAATGYKTPIGIIGLHGVHIQQVQDDSNNPWGPSRFRFSNAGIFVTTIVPRIDTVVTIQYLKATDSRNAIHGNIAQVRMLKLF